MAPVPKFSTAQSTIPIVDLSQADKGDLALKIVESFKKVGFVFVKNHGITKDDVSDTFKMVTFLKYFVNLYIQSKNLFSLPKNVLDTMKWENPESNRGYVEMGRENLLLFQDAATSNKDLKQSFEIGKENDDYANKWPSSSDLPHFQVNMVDFFTVNENRNIF